jgi:uncharacterized protein (TIGR00369 family)
VSAVPTIAAGFEHVTHFMDELVAFNKHLGVTVYHLTSGHCVLRLPPAPFLTGDPMRPAIHGGVLSTLIDTAGGAACFTRAESDDRLSTVDLRVDYLRPGPCGIEWRYSPPSHSRSATSDHQSRPARRFIVSFEPAESRAR